MTEVTIRELRKHGGEVVDQVAAGERVTVTRDGRAVAELSGLPRRRLTAAALVERHRHLPPMDLLELRRDIDTVIDSTL